MADIMVAAEMADWYEKNVREPNRHLQAKQFIDQYPDNFAVVLLSTFSATIEDINRGPQILAESIALDMMKLGTGAAEESKGGIAEDVLRVLSVTPVGRIVRGASGLVRPLIGRLYNATQITKYWATLRGKACVPIAIGQAMQRSGIKIVVTLEDTAQAMGRTVASFDKSGGTLAELRTALNAYKANFRETPGRLVGNWQALVAHVNSVDGVVLVPLTRKLASRGDTFHRVLVGKTKDGIKIFDRKGVFNSLEELSRKYGSASPAEYYNVNANHVLFDIQNWAMDINLAHKLDTLGPLGAVIVRGAMALMINPQKSPKKLAEEFEAYVRDHDAGPLPADPAPGGPPPADYIANYYVPNAGTMLSVVSMTYYGTYHMWPLIWDENKDMIGPNPNKVTKGIYLRIKKKEKYTPAQIEEAKKRSYGWKSYN